MRRSLLAGAVCLATATGIVGAAGSLGEGILPVGAILVVATFGSVAIHALLDPPSYGRPPFTGAFYRVWAALVALAAAAALATSTSSPDAAARLAYWSGFAAVAVFAGAVVHSRTTSIRSTAG